MQKDTSHSGPISFPRNTNTTEQTHSVLEKILFKTLDNVAEPIIVLHGFSKKTIYTNRAFLEITGLTSNAVELDPCNFLSDTDSKLFHKCLQECLQQQITSQLTLLNAEKNILTSLTASFEALDKDETDYQNMITITFHNLSGDEKEELTWLRTIDAVSETAMFIVEYVPEINDIQQVFWNHKAKEYFRTPKCPKGKLMGRDLGYPAETMRPSLESFQRLKKGQKVDEYNASPLPERPVVLTNYRLSETVDGHLIVLSCIREASEVMKYKSQLEKKENALQQFQGMNDVLQKFFDSAPLQMGVVTIINDDKDVLVESLNAIACRDILGRDSHAKSSADRLNITGTKLGYPPDDLALFIRKYRESQRVGVGVQFEYNPRSDTALSVTVIHVSGDRFVFLAQNISQSKKFTQQLKNHKEELEKLVWDRTKELENALKIKSRFLAVMSHEMRTPLSGLMGMISVLEETRLNGEQRTLLNTAQTCSKQLLALINDVLDLTKLEENKVELESAPFCIQTVVEEAVQVVSLEAEKKNLEVVCDADPALPPVVVGDATRIRQILVNLAGNSVKFSFKGEIVIKARPVESDSTSVTIEFMVKDQGIGIAESAKNSLFQPFTQADTSITRKFGGSGLGLNISHQLVKLMKGDIWFESKEGSGTTFFFTIKLQKTTPSREATPDDSFDLKQSQLLHEHEVVIVEQCIPLMNVLHKTISEDWKFKSTCFGTIVEATDFLDRNRPAKGIVFIDSKFGIEQVERFVMKYQHLYFVVMGYSHLRVAEKTRVGFLKKPVCKGTNASDIGSLYQLFASFYDHITHSEDEEPSNPLSPQSGGESKRKASFSASEPEPKRRGSVIEGYIQATHILSPSLSNSNSTFEISEASLSPPETRHLGALAVQNGPQLSVLVAEDNQMNQFVLKKMLENMNFTNLTIVENGKLCLDALNSKNYDIILMDVMMPEMDGIEATIRVWKDFPAHLQPVIIAVSANAFVEDRVRCLQAGMNDVLTKPINRNKMREVLVQCLNTKLARNENST